MKEETELLTRQLILRITGFEVPTQSYFLGGPPKLGWGWNGVFWSCLVIESIELRKRVFVSFCLGFFQIIFSELLTLCNQTCFFATKRFFLPTPRESIFQSSSVCLSISLHTDTPFSVILLCHLNFTYYI